VIAFEGLWWLFAIAVPLVFIQRSLHHEIQAVLLLVTRRGEISLVLFSLLFFPGILLHELSHWLTARLLGVRTGRFSLLPQPLPDGRMRLGYVETEQTDFVRDALIGAAPLFAGGLFVAFAGINRLGLLQLWARITSGGGLEMMEAVSFAYRQSDFWLWVYLTLVVSATMMPSRSDRRAWAPMLLALALLLGMGILVGAGPWLVTNLGVLFQSAVRAVAIVLAISLGVQLVLLLPFALTRRVLVRITGLDIA
jgi:hypothetical protein